MEELVSEIGDRKIVLEGGNYMGVLFTIVSALGNGHSPSLLLGRADYINNLRVL